MVKPCNTQQAAKAAGIAVMTLHRWVVAKRLADAHKRKFEVIVVWKFDRFARSVSHLLGALETFRALGIEFVSLSEQIDTSTPTGKMIFTVLGAVAELERSLIAERVRAGLRNARAKGKRLGRPTKQVSATQIAAPRPVRVGRQFGQRLHAWWACPGACLLPLRFVC